MSFSFARRHEAITERTPGASTAMGFSTKRCLPAWTAASTCSGRKAGGVVRRITSHVSITFLYASNPTNLRLSFTRTRSPTFEAANFARLASRWSSKTSATAKSSASGSALSACRAAPVPRPPHPISPTRSVSLFAADAVPETAAVAITAAEEAFKKSRRVGRFR